MRGSMPHSIPRVYAVVQRSSRTAAPNPAGHPAKLKWENRCFPHSDQQRMRAQSGPLCVATGKVGYDSAGVREPRDHRETTVSVTNSADSEEVPALEVPCMGLAKQIRQRLRETIAAAKGSPDDATYLWLYVSKAGIGRRDEQAASAPPLPVEAWLSIIDEAASLGVNWLVVSVQSRLNANPGVLEICRWAQDTHDMMVGLHTDCGCLDADEITSVSTLNPERTRLLVPREVYDQLSVQDMQGIKVCPAEPDSDDHEAMAPCRKPGKMVYVNPEGRLYTCGMVDGEDSYDLGNALEQDMRAVVHDPNRPHMVPLEHARHKGGCDGCPPIVVKRFIG
jgi:radical SAM protein with 4Fe4S-binding SPASM domain